MNWFKTVLGGGLFGNDKVEDTVTDFLHNATGIPTADEKRNQAKQVADQIQAYKDQTALTQREIDDARSQQEVEKRKINEKQIRSLRNNYRPSGGFLNNQAGAPAPTSLGSSPGLPTKLGNT